MAEKTASVGENVKLFCELPKDVKNQRSFSYKWTKDDTVIQRTNDHYKIRKYTFLKIKSVVLSDAGTYKCFVSNAMWNDSITVQVHILSKGNPFYIS